MYKDVAKKFLAGILTVCMILGGMDLSAFTVQASGIEDGVPVDGEPTDGTPVDGEQADGTPASGAVTEFPESEFRFEYSAFETYTRSQITPDVKVYLTDTDGEKELTKNEDFYLQYGTNMNVGTGTITVIGKNNTVSGEDYSSYSTTLNFTIKPKKISALGITVDNISDQPYTGQRVEPEADEIVVKDGSFELVQGTDYDYKIQGESIDEGDVIVEITGKGNYEGTRTAGFKIVKLSVDGFGVELTNGSNYDYTGAEVEPEVTVKYKNANGDEVLLEEESEDIAGDYSVEYSNNIQPGTATVKVAGKGKYAGMVITKDFVIQKNLSSQDISIDDIKEKVYTGSPIQLTADDITIYDRVEGQDNNYEYKLELGKDYEISQYYDNTDNGTAGVVISGKGAYKGSIQGTFTIRSATMDDIQVEVERCVYNGQPQHPAIKVSIGDTVYNSNDYEVVEWGDNVNAGTNAGKVTIKGKENGNLLGSPKTVYFDIEARPLEETNVQLPAGVYYYTGKEIKLEPIVQCDLGSGNVTLTEGTEYTVKHTSCVNAGNVNVTVTGKGNYSGTVTKSYEIKPASINSATLEDFDAHTYDYTGKAITPSVKVVLNGATLAQGTDYTISYANNVNAGQATITVTGKGNYTGTITGIFTINKKNIATPEGNAASGISVASLASQSYTGKYIEPSVPVTYNGKTLGESDISVKYEENMNVGEAKVTITGKDNFEGEITTSFQIIPRNISVGRYLTVQNLEEVYAYMDGAEIEEPSLQVRYVNTGVGMVTALKVDTDYTVTYKNNTDIGTADLIITGTGNYIGSKMFHFAIKGSMSNATISSIPKQVYTGKTITPEVEVLFGDKKLTKGRHYTVSYGDNIEPGTGTLTITGIGAEYYGERTVTFNIEKKDFSEDSTGLEFRGLNAGGYEYTGSAIAPEFTLYYNGIALKEQTDPADTTADYKVDYANNTESGTGTITITGLGAHFMGEFEESFTINPYNIGQANSAVALNGVVENVIWEQVDSTEGVAFEEVTDDEGNTKESIQQTGINVTYTYMGADGNPATIALVEDKDYTVSYENNDKIGTASVTITGKEGGNFTGTITKEFFIKGDLGYATVEPIADWGYLPPLNGEVSNKPEPIVKYNGEELKLGTDYTLSYLNNENVGDTATVIITATDSGNYSGQTTAGFTIVPRELSVEDSYLEISGGVNGTDYTGEDLLNAMKEIGYEYTGNVIIPELAVAYNGVPLVLGTDFELVSGSGNNTDVSITEDGTDPDAAAQPTVIIKAKEGGNYTGSIEIPFSIYPRTISESTAVVTGLSEDGYDYDDGNAIEISGLTLGYQVSETEVTDLVEGDDYTVEYADNEQIGIATITFTGKGNYTGTLERTFKIMGTLEDESYITVADPEPVPYGGGAAVYPGLVITDTSDSSVEGGKLLTLGEDFEILETECSNNVNVATADSANPPTVVIAGKGCYKGKLSINFSIEPKDLSEEMALPEEERDITVNFVDSINNEEVSNGYLYTGNNITPQIEVYNHEQLMSADTDYEVVGYVNNKNVPAEDAEEDMIPGVIIKARENGNYIGEMTLYFDIIPKDINEISGFNVAVTDEEEMIYDGTEKKPAVKVTYTTGEGENQVILEMDPENYRVDYKNNIKAATADAGKDAPTVIVAGTGNYTGERTVSFTIKQKDIADGDITAIAENVSYTGSPVTPVVVVKTTNIVTSDDTVIGIVTAAAEAVTTAAEEGEVPGILKAGIDYHLSTCTDVNAGTGRVIVYGDGNYTGERPVTFTINAQPLEDSNVVVEPIEAQKYTGAQIEPKPSLKFYYNNNDVDYVELAEETDYTLEYSDNINIGKDTAKVIIKAKEDGNYTGSIEKNFTITQKVIGNDGVIADEMTLQPIEAQIYTGEPLTPPVILTYHNAAGKTVILEEGTDYNIEYSANISIGTASAKITGKNNYSGTIETTFEIRGNIEMAEVAPIEQQRYNGSAITPLPEVSFEGKTLEKDTDYTVEYANNVERGIATITINGQNSYTGTKTVTFAISDDFSDAFSVTGVAPSYTYTGEDIEPAVFVTDGAVLTLDKDYTVSYENCRDVGTATITITGIGSFSGTRTVSFEIVPRNISAASFSYVTNQTYTGSKITPAVQVSYNGVSLTAGSDYNIVYVNNLKPGKASITVKGRGNFTGLKTINYNIEAPKISGLKQSGLEENSITLTWSKNDVVTGYEIYDYNNKLVKRIKSNSATSYTIGSLVSNTTYTYKVRTYVTKDGLTTRGDFVTIRTTTQLDTPEVTAISSKSSGKVVLEWSDVNGATDYMVYRSTSKDGGYTSLGTTSAANYTDNDAVGGTKYYYRVRVRKNLDGVIYYSAYSEAAEVTVKK